MITFHRALALMNASWLEAVREHRAELDIEHLLLGLVASGGTPAAVLGAHGVTLVGARRAVVRVRAERLRGIGIDAAEVPARPVRDITGLTAGDIGRLPMSRAAENVLAAGSPWYAFMPGDRHRKRRSARRPRRGEDFETGILRDLLDEPSNRIDAILGACGTSAAAIRAECAAAGAGRGRPVGARVLRAPRSAPGGLPGAPRAAFVRPGFWSSSDPAAAIALSHVVTADPATVRAVLEDPARITQVIDGTRRGAGADPEEVAFFAVDRFPDPDAITWRLAFSGDTRAGRTAGPAGMVSGYERFELVPVAGGTRVLRESARRTYGRIAPLWTLVSRRTMSWGCHRGMLVLSDLCARAEGAA